MVKLDLLSTNLVQIMNQVLQNQNLCKYLSYGVKNPLSQPDIPDTSVLMFKNVFPYPFDPEIVDNQDSSLRVFYLRGDLKTGYPVNVQTQVFFDLIVAKNNWLVNDGSPLIRPYEMMSQIVNQLDDKSFGTVGKLHFISFGHMTVDRVFEGLRLVAEMNTIS